MRANIRTWQTWVGSAALVSAAVCAAPGSAQAQARVHLDDDLVTPRMMALGGRGEAVGSSTSALFGNPGAMAGARVYHTDAFALYDPSINRFSFGSGVVDSTRVISAGLAYFYSLTDNPTDGRREVHDTRLSIAIAPSEMIGIGGTIRYLNSSIGPAAPNAELSTAQYDGFTLDAGVWFKPFQPLRLSVSGHNLNNQNNTATPLNMDISAAVALGIFSVVADAVVDFRTAGATRGRYSGGVELFLGGHYPLRVGYMYDDTRNGAQAITAGVGYLDQTVGLELSLRQGIVPEPQTTVMLSLRYFYQPTM